MNLYDLNDTFCERTSALEILVDFFKNKISIKKIKKFLLEKPLFAIFEQNLMQHEVLDIDAVAFVPKLYVNLIYELLRHVLLLDDPSKICVKKLRSEFLHYFIYYEFHL